MYFWPQRSATARIKECHANAKPYVTQYFWQRMNKSMKKSSSSLRAAATYEWLLNERQRKQQRMQRRVAKDQAARGPENIQHALEQHPDAVAPEELDEQFYWIQCYGC